MYFNQYSHRSDWTIRLWQPVVVDVVVEFVCCVLRFLVLKGSRILVLLVCLVVHTNQGILPACRGIMVDVRPDCFPGRLYARFEFSDSRREVCLARLLTEVICQR